MTRGSEDRSKKMHALTFASALCLSMGLAVVNLASTSASAGAAASSNASSPSYWEVASDGGIFSFGHAPFYGSLGGQTLAAPVVGLAATPDGGGYWEVEANGDVFDFGNASPSRQNLTGTVAVSPLGDSSYLEAGTDGSVILQGGTFATYTAGSSFPHNEPIVGLAADHANGGYWLVDAGGGVYSFGGAPFYGSMGGSALDKPIVGMAATPDGGGYWLVASDGGIFSFGDANFYGSMGGKPLNDPIVGLSSTTDGNGYWEVASDGGIFNFGDAGFAGSTGGKALNAPITGMAVVP
jgi:hypothetical protein